ncbi:RcpC/CpaB family pilus assembly protein [Streptomyces rubradiris]|uniref:RcpC/CpaB family pilus assembly protein n=1 Tax=Streptomyces rubradiris TaxID=285531 RepID=UPI0033DF47E5
MTSPVPHLPLDPAPSRRPPFPHPRSPARSSFPPPFRLPRPLGTDAPATREVPPFDPVRVHGGRYQLQRLVRHRRRALAVGLAVTAAALVAAGPGAGPEPHGPQRPREHPVGPARPRPAAELVTAPVRIADAATVRLLRPGDRVDVIAAQEPPADGARVLARGVRVTKVPEPPPDGAAESGALVVLSVPRAAAARLVGASATARLAVTLC